MDLEKLEKLYELKEKGILSEEEFLKEKQKMMDEKKDEIDITEKSSECCYDFSWLGVIKGSFVSFLSAIKRYNDFKGRTSRFDFWGANIFISIINFCVSFISLQLAEQDTGQVIIIGCSVFVWWLTITLTVRRLHDVNKSGWWILTLVVPFCVCFFKGDEKENRFGVAFQTNEKSANLLIIIQLLITVFLSAFPAFLGYII